MSTRRKWTWPRRRTDGLSGVGQALSLVMELESVQVAKNAVVTALQTAKTWLANAATVAWTGAQWLLNAALNANPIGLVVVAVVALIAVFVIAYKKSETFRELVDKLWYAIQTGAEAAARVVKDTIGKAWDKLEDILSWNPVETIREGMGRGRRRPETPLSRSPGTGSRDCSPRTARSRTP